MPQIILTKAADGLEIHNQLFLPKDLKPGEKRPTMIFVHGGPARQMLPAYHYMQFYHWAYAFNQWLADEGYIVLSINYRSGVGYGRSFRQASEHRGARKFRVSGRARRREVSAVAARTWTQRASGSGDFRTAACSRRRHSRATRICSSPASTSRACTCTGSRWRTLRSHTGRPRSRRSIRGSRRCSSCRATTIGTSISRR